MITGPNIAGDTVEYPDLESGGINYFYDGTAGTPTVVHEAESNHAVTVLRGKPLGWLLLILNTQSAPFNKLQARQAIDYCTDRPALSSGVYGGLDKPDYIFAGPDELYNPSDHGAKPSKGFYNYDPAKGEALVQSLGGLSFALQVPTAQNISVTLDEAMAQEWESCGMKVTLEPLSTPQATQLRQAGSYQMAETGTGNFYYPYGTVALYALPGSTYDYGLNIPTLTNLIEPTGYTDNPTALQQIWTRVYYLEDSDAVDIPLLEDQNFYYMSDSLHGLRYAGPSAYFNSAWVS